MDAGVGRVFADNPAKLIAAIEGYNIPLSLENAAVFQLENDSVNWDNQVEIVLLPLISEKFAKGNPESGFAAGEYYHFDNESLPWDREVFTDALAKAGITMIWTHASHMIMNAPQGEPITASDLDRHTAAPGHVLIGPGGHSGYSVAHNSAEGNYFAYEHAIVNSCLEKQIAYFAPSVFGLGYVGAVGYHELILQRFLDNLFTPAVSTIGEAQISFAIEPGQTVALVGPTGAGKTTLVNLMTRFYDVDAGVITIDGRDIRAVRRDSLRAALGIVLQDTHLFSETVRENIRYGRPDAKDDEVEAAARAAFAEPFIRRLPRGYDTVLTADGGNLSQGQRQLLSIARAVLADPAILILDEATSSVDTRTEVQIQAAMLRLLQGRSSLVIAHRLSTIRSADLILVLNAGRIVERGTHAELLAAKGFYYELYLNQFRRAV